MTDTTDIKALRELLCHEDLESDYHVGVTVTTLRLLLSKADALEAERQRADELQAEVDRVKQQSRNRLQGLCKAGDERDKAEAEIAALKAKLANPVVLPELCSVFEGEYADSPQIVPDQDGYVFYSHRVIESIIIAGFTVKGDL